MEAEGHWAFVLSAYAVALGLPTLLGVWTWQRGRTAAKTLAAMVVRDRGDPPIPPSLPSPVRAVRALGRRAGK
jgi:hypothetical protein